MNYLHGHCVIDGIDLDEIYLLYSPRLLLLALKITRDREESEEIIQDVFIRLWLKNENLAIKYSLKSYLFRSVYYACLDYLRKEKVQHKSKRQEILDEYNVIEFYDPVLLEELEHSIHISIEKLPIQCKKIFLLHRNNNLTYKQIAAQLNISVKTVETHMGRAVKSLKKDLLEYLPQIFL